MHISNRTLIEIALGGAAVGLLIDAYSTNASIRKTLVKSRDMLLYLTDVIDREKVPMTQFDAIAIDAISRG